MGVKGGGKGVLIGWVDMVCECTANGGWGYREYGYM